ncbi:hypothetical protein K443DRAFT_116027, partial [Laccaria amethystina LaAM-08-1]
IRRTVGPHVQTPAAVGWPVCHPVLLSQTFFSASDCSSTNCSPYYNNPPPIRHFMRFQARLES